MQNSTYISGPWHPHGPRPIRPHPHQVTYTTPSHHHLQNITTSKTSPPPKHYHFQNITTSRTPPLPKNLKHHHFQNDTNTTPLNTDSPPENHHVNSLFLPAATTANAAAAAGADKDCVALQTPSG